jgi:hypothetical protein
VRETQPGSTLELRITRDRKETTLKAAMPSQQRRQTTAGTIPI